MFNRIRFSGQMALVICLFALLPTVGFCAYMLHTSRTMSIDTRRQEIRLRNGLIVEQVDKAAEVCTMSTQVFLNTPALVDHLEKLQAGTPISAAELLEFYDNDIASLEKVVVGNPYLYQIRVFSSTDSMNEMLPILYSASRMQRTPWAGRETADGTWVLDFTDRLFDAYAPTEHVMSLVTTIPGENGTVGTLEVAMQMNDILPELFSDSPGMDWACLVDSSGVRLAGGEDDWAEISSLLTGRDLTSETLEQVRVGGQNALLTIQPLSSLHAVYVSLNSLADIEQQLRGRYLQMVLGLAIGLGLVVWLIVGLCRRMLCQFYAAFDAVKRFSLGDTAAAVAVEDPESEVGRFALGINAMLESTRRLMQDNINRELLAKNAELRALQNQINAHFIYNVLEAIKMMAEIDEEYEIADAVTNLGKLLRYGLKWDSRNVTVEQEIDNIRNYLSLMNLRFDYEIRLRLEMPPELLEQSIPKMSLQPIVENAVVHGMEFIDDDTEILVRGVREDDNYRIDIIDHGCGMTPEIVEKLQKQIEGEVQPHAGAGSGNGLGLKNVQDRIRMKFGPPYGLSVSSELGQYTRLTVLLPYIPKGESRDENDPRSRG